MKKNIPRYSPDLTRCRVDLSDNTNAWGSPPAALEVIARGIAAARYPTPYGEDLKAALAAYTHMPASMIATGCGSDDILDCAMRAFGEAGDRLMYPAPTFMMVPVFGQLNGLVPVASALADLPGDARVIYLCSPNNPTGMTVPRADIEALLARCTGGQVVIIDEAYAEFAGTTAIDLVGRHENLLVTRTMSKAFGLAGMRIGYAIGNPTLIDAIEKARGPYKLASLSEAAAVAALTDGLAWMVEQAAIAVLTRERFAAALRERGLDPLPSSANFVFVPIANAIAVARRMRELGVAVRGFATPSGLRITVAPWGLMEDALAALDQARTECA